MRVSHVLCVFALVVASAVAFDNNGFGRFEMQPSRYEENNKLGDDVRFMEEARNVQNGFDNKGTNFLEQSATSTSEVARAQALAAQQAAQAAAQAAALAARTKTTVETEKLAAATVVSDDDDEVVEPMSLPPPKPDPTMDATDKKLLAAMQEVKLDVVNKANDIKKQAEWIQKVEDMIADFHVKITNVHTNMESQKQELKALAMKKRQIQNLQIQRQLEKQLELASSSLESLKDQLQVVQKKKTDFDDNKSTLEGTISNIKEQLAALKGGKPVKPPKPEEKKDEAAVALETIAKAESNRINDELAGLGL